MLSSRILIERLLVAVLSRPLFIGISERAMLAAELCSLDMGINKKNACDGCQESFMDNPFPAKAFFYDSHQEFPERASLLVQQTGPAQVLLCNSMLLYSVRGRSLWLRFAAYMFVGR